MMNHFIGEVSTSTISATLIASFSCGFLLRDHVQHVREPPIRLIFGQSHGTPNWDRSHDILARRSRRVCHEGYRKTYPIRRKVPVADNVCWPYWELDHWLESAL